MVLLTIFILYKNCFHMWNFRDYGYSKIILIHCEMFERKLCKSSENDVICIYLLIVHIYLASLCTQVNYKFGIIDLK